MSNSEISVGASRTDLLFEVSGTRYLVDPRWLGVALPISRDFAFATVFCFPRQNGFQVTKEWIRQMVQRYKAQDDVFNQNFLYYVIFKVVLGFHQHDVQITPDAENYLKALGNMAWSFDAALPAELLPGPYALVKGELRQVSKLVDDSNGTCMATLKPLSKSSDTFETVPIKSSDNQFLSFALPSRISTVAAHVSPLAGLRILIQDNIHLKGIKTSVGNKAFYNTYQPRVESARCIQDLIDLGVVITGKTKMASFGNWEEPTEYTDYQAPWNPRADRYQSPGGGSSGSACAIAAYDWLDIAIGTDTWGCLTRSALWCGCFGLRPSTGALCVTGVEPCVKTWDTPGILTRDLKKCRYFAEDWLNLGSWDKNRKPFSSIIWPTDFWNIIDAKQTETARKFAQTMKWVLKVPLEEISFEQVWATLPPPEANTLSLQAFIEPVPSAIAYDVYHNSDEFRTKYRELFNEAPYTSPPNEQVWSIGREISKEDRDVGFQRIDIYKKWFCNTVFTGNESNALVILPLETMTARYRDQPPKFKRPSQDGIHALALGPVLGSPVLAVPIDEIPYFSSVSDREEKFPFAVAVMGLPGTDMAVIDATIQTLEALQLPTVLKTGRVMFDSDMMCQLKRKRDNTDETDVASNV